MMKFFCVPFACLLLVCCCMPAQTLYAQKAPATPAVGDNLVPNPGFEQWQGFPIGWFYKGADFTKLVKYWSSPTGASPDAYNPKVRVPESWAEQGFGKQKPHTGQAMAGITVYGCTDGKPHCREYIQIQLKEALVVGQDYALEFWVAHLPQSIRINRLGAYFSDQQIKEVSDTPLQFEPTVFAEKIIYADTWTRITLRFKASTEADWLILGNFSNDKITSYKRADVMSLNFAYYYLDDVSLRKVPPILPIPVGDDDLTKQPLEVGNLIRLKNIYFETDRDELQPRSEYELLKLVGILKAHPTMQIEIIGHTDTQGSDEYNLLLSKQRAMQVIAFLMKRSISGSRLQAIGKGSREPIADNADDQTRPLNRRVEFRILKK